MTASSSFWFVINAGLRSDLFFLGVRIFGIFAQHFDSAYRTRLQWLQNGFDGMQILQSASSFRLHLNGFISQYDLLFLFHDTWLCELGFKLLLLKRCRVALPSVVDVLSPHMFTEGISFDLRWMIINMQSETISLANSRNRCNCRRKSWTVVRIDLPLATDPVSPRLSRLTNVRYCLIRLLFCFCRRRLSM